MTKITAKKTINRAAQDATLINVHKLVKDIARLENKIKKLELKVESINIQYFKK